MNHVDWELNGLYATDRNLQLCKRNIANRQFCSSVTSIALAGTFVYRRFCSRLFHCANRAAPVTLQRYRFIQKSDLRRISSIITLSFPVLPNRDGMLRIFLLSKSRTNRYSLFIITVGELPMRPKNTQAKK